MLDWINVFKVNRKIKSRLWPWIKIILSIILFFAVFYGDTYVPFWIKQRRDESWKH